MPKIHKCGALWDTIMVATYEDYLSILPISLPKVWQKYTKYKSEIST